MATTTYNDNNTTATVDIDSTSASTTVNLNNTSGSNDEIDITAASVTTTVNLNNSSGNNEDVDITATTTVNATVNLNNSTGTNDDIEITGATVNATVNLNSSGGGDKVDIYGSTSTTAVVNLNNSRGNDFINIVGGINTNATVNLNDSGGSDWISISGANTSAVVNLNSASGHDTIDITGATSTATVNLANSSNDDTVVLVGLGIGTINATNSSGNDTLIGGAGSDTIIGGSGADTENLRGGGTLYAGSGADLGIFTLSDHYAIGGGGQLQSLHGDVDFYYGQGGINTLDLMLTAAQWSLPAVQADLANYAAFLATNPSVNQTYTFHFGAASGALTVAGWQYLDVQIAGAPILTATGVEGSPTVLSIVAAVSGFPGGALTSLVISAIPVGATVSDGLGNTFTATSGSTSVDVHAWNLSGLTITPPNDTNFTLTITATKAEGAGSIVTTASELVTVDPLAPTVTPATATGGEGSTIALSLGITVNSETGTNGDSPANRLNSVTIGGIPAGATLSNAHGDTLTISGGAITFNAAQLAGGVLTGLAITPASEYEGSFSLSVAATEVDAEGNLSTTTNAAETITVNPVAEAGTASAPASLSTSENTTSVAVSGVVVGPTAEDGDDTVSVVLAVGHGTLSVGSLAGVTVSNNNSGSVTVAGSAASVNTLLGGLTYTPTSEYEGSDTLNVTVTSKDGSSTSATQGMASTAITVSPVAEAGTASAPASLSTSENATSVAVGGVVVGPTAEDGDDTVSVVLAVGHGTLSVGSLAGVTVTANNSGSVTVAGSAADVNTLLSGLTYTPTAEYEGGDTLNVTVTSKDGASTSATQGLASTAITVSPVAEAGTASAPASLSTNENATSVAVTGVVVGPTAEDGDDTVSVVLAVGHGTLGVGTLTGVTVSNNNSGSVTVAGSAANVNTLLSGLTYTPTAEYEGGDTLNVTVTSKDGASTSATQGLASTAITVSPVAEAGTASAPASLSTNENASSIAVTGVVVGPTAEDGDDTVSVVLAVGHGTLSVGTLTGVTVSNNNSGSVTVAGSAANVNTLLGGLTYTPTSEYEGADALNVTVTSKDGASTSATQGLASTAITVTGVPDTAVVSVPDAKTITENHAAIALTGLSLTSADPGTSDDADTYNVTLSVGHGTLALASTTGLSVSADGSAGTLTFSGSLADVNAALGGVSYTVAGEFEGADTLSFTSSTTEEAGVGGATSTPTTQTAAITVNGVADTPAISTPAAKTLNENLSVGLTGLTIASGDPGTSDDGDSISVTLSVGHGALALTSATGLTVTANGSAGTLTFSGSLADVSAALADNNITYTPTSEFEGGDTLSFTASSTEEAAAGGASSAPVTKTAAITINPVAEAGTASAPASLTTSENATGVALGGVVVGPTAEDGDDTVSVVLAVGHGTLSVGSQAGVTVTANNSGSVTLAGSAADVNTLLGGLTYTPTAEYEGADTLNVTVTSSDGSSTSSTKGLASTAITINGVADTPTTSTPAAQSLNENGSVGLTGLSVAEATGDSGDTISVTLSVANGSLSVGGAYSGLTGTFSGSSVTFSGLASAVNAALADNNITYAATNEFEGSDTLHFTATATEETGGSTSAATTDHTATITISPVAEAGTASAPASLTTNENATSVALSGVVVGPTAEDGDDTVSVVLAVGHGTLSVGSLAGVTVSNNNSGSVTVAGSAANVNSLLAGLSYTPTAEYEGGDTLNVTVTSKDGSSTSSTLGTASTAITIDPVAEAGTASAPASLTTNENATSVALSGVVVGPTAEDGDDTVSVVLAVGHGTLSVGSLAGVTVTANNSGSVTLAGSAASVNSLLGGLTYTPTAEYEGGDTLNVTVTSKDGSSTSATQGLASTAITVSPVAEAGTASAPASVTTSENATSVAVSGVVVGPAAEDGDDTVSVVLAVGHGTLSVGSQAGVTVTNNGSGTVTVAGSAANVNTLLGGLTYTPTAEYEGADTLNVTVTSSDGSNISATQGTASTAITVSPVAEAGTASAPASLTTSESATSVAVSGVVVGPTAEDGDDTVSVVLAVGHGTLSVGSQAGVTVTNNGSGSVTVAGAAANVNTLLGGLTYTPTAEYEGADTLNVTVTSSDGASTSATQGLASTAITVAGVADTPTTSTPAAQSLNEGASVGLTGLSVTEAAGDSGDTISVTLSVGNGSLSVGGAHTGLTGTFSGSSVTFSGLASAVNAALTDNNITYTPTSEFEGSDTLHFTATATEETGGSTSAPTTDHTATITINPVAEAGTASAPATLSTSENATSVALSGVVVGPTAEDGDDTVSVVLAVGHGTLSVGSRAGVTVTSNNSGSVTLAGSATDVNSLLGGLTYTPTAEYEGGDTLNVTVTSKDGSSTSATQGLASTAITVNPVAEAGTASAPASLTTSENATSVAVSGVVVGPAAEDGDDTVSVVLAVGHGTLGVGSLAGVTVTNNSSGSVTVAGSATDVNTLLGGLTYTPTAEYEGADTLNVTVTSSDGSSTSATQGLASTAITVNPVAEAGTASAPASLSTSENATGVAVSGVVVGPTAEDGDDTVSVVLAVGHGSLSVGSLAGVTVTANNSGSVTVAGSAADVNSLLGGLTYTPTAEYEGADTLNVTVTSKDGASTSATQGLASTAITVNPVAEAGTASAPTTLSTSENATSVAVSGVVVGPTAEDGDDTVSVVLAVGHGTLSVGSLAGVTVTANNSGSVTLAGSAASVNSLMSGLTYTPMAEYEGGDTLNVTVTSNDGASTSATQGLASTAITVNPVAEAGTASAPATLSTSENATSVAVSGVVVGPTAEDGDDSVSVVLAVGHGTLSVGSLAGVTVTANNSGSVTLAGSAASVNSLMSGLTYTPTAEYEGGDTLNVTVTSKDGSSTSVTQGLASTAITVNPVAEAGTASASASLSTSENATSVAVSGVVVGPTAEDGDDSVSVVLAVGHGTLSVGSLAGVTVTANNSGSVTVAGSAANVNTLLGGLTYTPTSEYEGADTLNVTVTSSDGSSTSATQGLASTAITVSPVAEAGTASAPATLSTSENATGVAVSGVVVGPTAEDGDDTVSVVLAVGHGTLSVGSLAGVTVTANNSGSVTVAGSAADVNTLLGGLTYTPTAEYEGADTLNVTVTSSDGSNTSATQGLASTTITVSPVAEAGTASAPATLSTSENATSVAVSGVVVGPTAEDGDDTVSVVLAVGHGTLSVGSLAGVTVSNNNSGSVTLAGSAASVNSLLGGLTYTPTAEYEGGDTLNVTVTSKDGSSTSATQGLASTAITVSPVAEAGTASAPASVTTSENATSVAVSGVVVGPTAEDTDDTVSVVLAVGHGTLSVGSLAGVTVTNNGSGSVSLAGSAADVNTLLGGLTYTPTAEYEGADILNVTVTSKDGSSTSATQGLASTAITVNGVADTPTISTPAAQNLTENGSVGLTGLSVTEATGDSGDIISVTLSVANGSLSVGGAHTGLTGAFSGSSVTFSGLASAVNAALADNNITYTPTAEFEGSDTLHFTATSTEEVGGSTSAATTDHTAPISINGIADTPTISTPAAQSLNEGAFVGLTGLSVAEAAGDSGDTISVTLSVANGSLSVASHAGLTGTFSGSSVTFSGLASAVNAALADNNITYTPTDEFEGSDTLHFTATATEEAGGSTSAPTTDHTATITINSVAEAGTASAPATLATSENATGVAVSGVVVGPTAEDGDDTVSVVLAVGHGTLTVGSQAGVTVTANNSGSVTLAGSAASVNTLLGGLTYTPTSEYEGADTLNVTVTSSDGSSTSATQGLASTAITVSPAAEAGTASAPASLSTSENATSVAVSGVVVGPTAEDGDDTVSVVLAVGHGTLSVGSLTGVTVTANNSGSVTLAGSAASVNSLLGGLTYTPTAEYEGGDTLNVTVTSKDGSSTSATQGLASTAITVSPVAEAGTASAPASLTTSENATSVAVSGVVVGPAAEDGDDTVSVVLAVGHGTLSVGTLTGVTVTNNSSGSVTVAGSAANVNTLLGGLTYTPTAEYEGVDQLNVTVTSSDGSSTSATQGLASTAITVNGVADTPTISTPAAQSLNEGAFVGLTGLSVAEAAGDSGDTISVTLSVANGSLSLASHAGLTGTFSGSSVTFSGLASAVNAALADNNITYTPTSEFEGADTLHFTATATEEVGGSTSAATTDHTATITINGVADTPTTSTPTAKTLNENASVGLTGLSVSEAAGDSGDTISVTLSVGSGSLSVATHAGLTGSFSGASVTFSGLASDVNAALTDGNITYTPTSEFEGSDTLHFTATATEEAGGSTSAATTDHTATITINGVADTPTTSTPTAKTLNEGASVGLTGLSVSEAAGDSGDTISVTLSVGSGSLSVATHAGLTGTFSGASVTFSGLASDVNAALTDNNITYTPTSEFEGSDTLHFTATSTEEAGGSTSAATTDHTATITINGVADTPTTSTPAAKSLNEGASVGLTGLSVSEAAGDSGDTISVTLSVVNGSLSVASHVGLTGTFSGSSVTFSGLASAVNAALADNNITYAPTSEFEGSDTLHFTAKATEETGGSTSPATTDHTATITINQVAEAGTASAPASLTTSENATNVALAGVVVGPSAEDGDDAVSVVLAVGHGTLMVGSLAGVTVTNNNSGLVTVAGSAANVNSLLTGLTYTPTSAFEGSDTLNVTVTSKDGSSTSATLGTASTAITVNHIADLAASLAGLTGGNAVQGAALSVGTVTDGGVTVSSGLTYQWQLNGVNISAANGGTASSYTPTEADEGKALQVIVTQAENTGSDTVTKSAGTVVDVAPAPATPTISGSAVVEGSVLTASSVTTGSDEALGIAYQWQHSTDGTTWTNVAANGTSSTYTLAETDENGFVRVQETFTDDTGQSTTLSSASTPKVYDVAPAPATPTISGSAVQGSVLTASSVTTGSDEALGIAYQWQHSSDGTTWTNVAANGTSSTYTLAEADENDFVRVQETFTDDTGQSTTLNSAATATKVVDVAPSPATPTISGSAVEGSVLTASSVTTGSDEALAITYQWQHSTDGTTWTNVAANGTSSTYTLAETDENEFVRVQETFTDDTGQSTTLSSAATATKVVDVAPSPATPTISGSAVEGSVLTASSVATGSDEALGIAYQWQHSTDGTTWTNVAANGTSSTYTLAETDENAFVRVQETFTDDTGQSTTLNSAATATKVAEILLAPTITAGAHSNTGNNGQVTFVVTFPESVAGVAANDFTLFGTATGSSSPATILSVSGSGTTYTVTVEYAENKNAGLSLGLNFVNTGSAVHDTEVGETGNLAIATNFATPQFSSLAPAGVAGSAIDLALTDPSADPSGPVAVAVSGIPSDWTLSAGTHNADGTWTVLTSDPSGLTVTTPSTFTGAAVLQISESWTNADGSAGSASIADNVEAYAPGDPIFAVSGNDTLTGAGANDTFVFAQPIGADTVHNFNVASDRIDLVGFSGFASFSDVQAHTANDANGNAVITLGAGESITLVGVGAASLTAGDFVFNQQPTTTNAGAMTIGDAAILPLAGVIDNTGSIALNSTGDETDLEVLSDGVVLQGGGHVALSDNAQNVIFGAAAGATLTNADNTISGAGQIGAGQLALVNQGVIDASGTTALVIDTGANVVTNSGVLEATGSGGLVVNSALDNSGSLLAETGALTLKGAVTGAGTATISGSATLEFGAASAESTNFAAGAAGSLKLDASSSFTGVVSGFGAGESLDLADIAFGANTTLGFSENSAGTGGTLTVSDGVHTASIALMGQYSAAGFQEAADPGGGSLITYAPPPPPPAPLAPPGP